MASLNNFESFSTRRESFWNTGHSDFGSINVSDLGEGAKLHSLAAFEKDPAFAQVFEYPASTLHLVWDSQLTLQAIQEENYVEDALEQYKPPDIPFHQHLRPEDTLSNYTCDSSMFSHDSASTAATALSVDSWSAWSVGSANSQDVAMPFSKSSLVSDPPDVFVVAPTASQERTGAVASSSTRRSGGKTRSSIHTGLHTCQWLGCSKGYKDKGSLKTHVDRDHFGKKALLVMSCLARSVSFLF